MATDREQPLAIQSAGGNWRGRTMIRSERAGTREEKEEEERGEEEEECEGKSMEREGRYREGEELAEG